MNKTAIIAANWKMNGSTHFIHNLLDDIKNSEFNHDVIIFPNYLHMNTLHTAIKTYDLTKNIAIGAQNISEFDEGAYTGETSASMAKEFSAKYVLVGHSERRELFKESDKQISNKIIKALDKGLTPILCIGETLEQQLANQTESVLKKQLQNIINNIGTEYFSKLILAYEPVWAIGTGKTATAEIAQNVHKYIRQFISQIKPQISHRIPILYGGSVNASTHEELLTQADIDGLLIGSASLDSQQFKTICNTKTL